MASTASLGPQIQAPFGISLGPQLQAPFGTKNPGRFQARKPQEFPRKQQELPRPSRQTPVPLPSKLPPRVAGHSGSENQSAPPEQQDLRRSQRQTTSPQELPKYTGMFTVPARPSLTSLHCSPCFTMSSSRSPNAHCPS
jgi:hypothetical protein